ncbi:MAG: MATE family efflux transporter [bacterium]
MKWNGISSPRAAGAKGNAVPWAERLDSALLGRLWEMAWPTVMYSLMETGVGLVDIYFAGYLGPEAVAAIGFSRQIFLVLMIGTLSITTGTITLIAQNYGARRFADASAVAYHSLILALLSGILFGAAGYALAHVSLRLLGAEGEVLRGGTAYLKVLMGGVIFLMINYTTNAVFRAQGDTKTPMKIATVSNGLNIVFSYLLIFGWGLIPAFGVMGAAGATLLARLIGASWAVWILLNPTRAVHFAVRARFDWALFRRILDIGLPSGFSGFFRNGARILFFSILAATTRGADAVAAATVGFQIRMLVVMPALAFQVATAALVGQSIGARRMKTAEAYGWTSIAFCTAVMGAASLLIFAASGPVMRFFSDSAALHDLGIWALRFIALEQFCNGVAIVVSGVFTGAGDTRPPLRFTILSQWLLMLPLAYGFTMFSSLDFFGPWIAWALAPLVQLLLTLAHFIRGRWKIPFRAAGGRDHTESPPLNEA